MALPPRLARSSDQPTPLPTPPSSTTAIQLCFPSPTSVAQVLSHSSNVTVTPTDSAEEVLRKHADHPHPHTNSLSYSSHTSDSHQTIPPNNPPAPQPNQQPQPQQQQQQRNAQQPDPPPPPADPLPPSSRPIDAPALQYYRPELRNANPAPPKDAVSKSQFVQVLDDFVAMEPPNKDVDPTVLVVRIRNLLDHLDALTEQLSLHVTNALFDALAHPNCLSILVFLLSDISARSSPTVVDIRKSFRYPYIVANILANGTIGFREVFIASKPHVEYLLSFLDGDVALSSANPIRVSVVDGVQELFSENSSESPVFARQNSVIVGNVVQILVSYMETSPEALLQEIRLRRTFIPSLVNLLHIGSMPRLLNCLILDRCVEDMTSMDPGHVLFDTPMVHALAILADSAIFHHLANAFIRATQTIYSALGTSNSDEIDAMHNAEQLSYNIVGVFGTLVNKTVRATRLSPVEEQYRNLRIFSDESAASTLVEIVRIGIELFRETGGTHVGQLHLALGIAIDALKHVAQDRDKRVASVTGQPLPLDLSGFETSIEPCLRGLMEVLMDIVASPKHGQTRLRIMELFMEVQRVCSEGIVDCFDRVRFGEVALRMIAIHPRNSLLHYIICQGVEFALISSAGGGRFAQHWLVKSRLVQKLLHHWHKEDGEVYWDAPAQAANRPFLSALVHMGCCVEHWAAMVKDSGEDPNEMVDRNVMETFDLFCTDVIHKVMNEENQPLGGPRPRRRPGRITGGSFARSFGSFGATSGAMLRRGGGGSLGGRAHLVRSPSAHRFGYVAPIRGAGSRLDDVFGDNGPGRSQDAFAGFGGRSATSFASIFDEDSDTTL